MFGCKHIFGEIKDGYQYCKKCNKAVSVDNHKCEHIWEKVKTIERYNWDNLSGVVYVLKCKKCGEIKSVEIA